MVVVVVDVAVVVGAVVAGALVSTGANVVNGMVVLVSLSSPPQAVAMRATATKVKRGLEILTEPECIRIWGTTSIAGTVDGMVDLVDLVATELSSRADPEKAVGMAAYLKTDMPFYGVQKKGRVEVFREIQKQLSIDDVGAYRSAIESLWEQPHREEKYLAIAIAKRYDEFLTFDNIDLYRRLIVAGAWWDFVDEVAINCVGIVFLRERERTNATIEAWIDDEVMWLRRTSLIAPIKHKAATDHEMLFDHCLRRAAEKEFFIRKAIGWTLREYAKTEPDRVRDFLLQHRTVWSGLSFREASKHLDI